MAVETTAVYDVAMTADGTLDSIQWRGGAGTLFAQGSFGGGTLTVEFTLDGGTTWTAVSGVSLTAAGNDAIDVGPVILRVKLAGATNPSITVRLVRNPMQ